MAQDGNAMTRMLERLLAISGKSLFVNLISSPHSAVSTPQC